MKRKNKPTTLPECKHPLIKEDSFLSFVNDKNCMVFRTKCLSCNSILKEKIFNSK